MKNLKYYLNEALKITGKSGVYADDTEIIESELKNKFNVRLTKSGGFEIIDKSIVNYLKAGDRKYVINGNHTAVRYQKYYEYINGKKGWEMPQPIKLGLHNLDECIEALKNYLIKRKEL